MTDTKLEDCSHTVARNDVIEECARVCKELKAKWQSGECGHSVSDFDACEAAIRSLKQKAPEPVAVERYADKLVREYVAALLANDKDAAGKATCAMADYVMRPVNRAAIDMRDYALDARADLEKQNEKLKNQLRRWKDRAGSQE